MPNKQLFIYIHILIISHFLSSKRFFYGMKEKVFGKKKFTLYVKVCKMSFFEFFRSIGERGQVFGKAEFRLGVYSKLKFLVVIEDVGNFIFSVEAPVSEQGHAKVGNFEGVMEKQDMLWIGIFTDYKFSLMTNRGWNKKFNFILKT